MEPTYAYFEKVSEEMDLIVRQVTQVNEKVMTNGEIHYVCICVHCICLQSPLNVAMR